MLLSSCSERNPIGRRTEPDRTADGIRSDGGRNPIGRRTETVGGAAVSAAPTKQTEQSIPVVSARLCRLPEQELHQPSQQNNLLSSNSFHSDLQQIIRARKNKTRIYRIKRMSLAVAEVSGLRSKLRYNYYPTWCCGGRRPPLRMAHPFDPLSTHSSRNPLNPLLISTHPNIRLIRLIRC